MSVTNQTTTTLVASTVVSEDLQLVDASNVYAPEVVLYAIPTGPATDINDVHTPPNPINFYIGVGGYYLILVEDAAQYPEDIATYRFPFAIKTLVMHTNVTTATQYGIFAFIPIPEYQDPETLQWIEAPGFVMAGSDSSNAEATPVKTGYALRTAIPAMSKIRIKLHGPGAPGVTIDPVLDNPYHEVRIVANAFQL